MNLHFASFLVDMASWVIFGFIYSKYIQKMVSGDKRLDDIASVKIALVALLGGLIATMDRSLPEYGFSFYHLFVAMIFAFVYSLRYISQIRKYLFNHLNYFIKSISSNLYKRFYPQQRIVSK